MFAASVAARHRRGDEPGGEALFRASSVICGPSTITQAAAGTGFLNAAPDRDGTLRRLPLLVEYNGRVYPGLALAAVLAHSRPTLLVLTVDAPGALNLRINDRHVPLDRRSGLLLRFRGSGRTFPHISAADILTNSVPAERLRGKVILVGGCIPSRHASAVPPRRMDAAPCRVLTLPAVGSSPRIGKGHERSSTMNGPLALMPKQHLGRPPNN